MILLLFSSRICTATEFNKGFYIGGSTGYGDTALNRPQQVTSFSRDGFAWSVLAGYKIDKIISTEMGYFRMHNVTAAISSMNVLDTIEPSFTYIALKGEFKIISCLQGYGKIGGAYSYGKDTLREASLTIRRSEGRVVPYISSGIEYILKKKFILFVDVSNTSRVEQVPRIITVSIGFLFNIGAI